MNIIKAKNKLFERTAVPNIFIKEYLPSLSANAVKLYLYILYAADNDVNCDDKALANILDCDVSVVKESLIILESYGLIAIENETVILMDIIQKEIEKNYRHKTVSRPDDLNETCLEKKYARSRVQKAISDKFFSGQMPISWYNEIDDWFEKYNFEPDVIFLIFQHCSNNMVMTKAYIRKVAESWGEKHHIRTSEQLEKYLKSYEGYKVFRKEILKRLKWRRNMNIYEEEIVEKWFYTYKYDLEIIEIALKKSITKNNATLATFDAIITSWFKYGLKTKEDILNYEQQRRKAYADANKKSETYAALGSAEQKNNFKERKYDEDYLNSFIVSEEENNGN